MDKFLSRAPTFSGAQFYFRARSDTHKMVGQNQSVCPIETQLETFLFVLYYLKQTCSFHFNSASIESFCNEAFVVWMLFWCLKKDAPQRIIFILQTDLSKVAQKNLLKAWNFTKNKIYPKCFDNNLQKRFWTKILIDNNIQKKFW